MSTQYILSTLTNSLIFVKYAPVQLDSKGVPTGAPRALRRIRVAGGANRPNMIGRGEVSTDNEGVPMWTPEGVCSPVLEEDLKWLMQDPSFKQFIAMRHIKIVDTDLNSNRGEMRKVIAGELHARDSMAPMLPDDPRNKLKGMKVDTGSNTEGNLTPMTDDIRALIEG